MKVRNIMMAAIGCLALGSSFADAPQNTYVRPAGDNTPAEPYDTWEAAANEIRTAEDLTATNGLVTVASGDYSGEAKPRIAPKQAVTMKIVDAAGSTAPGEITVGTTLFGFATANTDPNCHSLTISQGTVKVPSAAQNVFTDGYADGGASGSWANFHLTLTGSKTLFQIPSQGFYCGWNCRGTVVHVTDGATVNASATYIGNNDAASGATLIVDGGASITNKNDLHVGESVSGCSLTVSNAYVKSSTVYVGATAANTGARVTLAGAISPAYQSPSVIYFRQGSTFEINVADAPLEGYSSSQGLAYIASWSFDAASRIQFSGLEQLRDRLRAAGKKSFSSKLLCQYTGATFSFPDEVWAAATESISAVPGFSVSYSGPWVSFAYTEPGAEHTYVVPAGTEGNVPTENYDTWEKAANKILDASADTAPNGTITIASGTYAESGIVGKKAANVEAVVSSEDDSAGTVTFGNVIFGKGTVSNAAKDPKVNSLTFSKGTFISAASNDGSFVDYNSSGWGIEANCRFAVTGASTVFTVLKDGSRKPLYAGYTMKGVETTFADGAQASASTLYVGLSADAANSGVFVLSGATLAIDQNVVVGQKSDGDFVVVSNGTLTCGADFSLGKAAAAHGETLTLAGTNAQVVSSSSFTANGNSRVVFNVADAPLEGYLAAPLQAQNVTLSADATLQVVGAEAMLARQAAAEMVGRTRLVLAEAKTGTLTVSDAQLQAAQATLPEDAKLSLADNRLILKVGKPAGALLIVR